MSCCCQSIFTFCEPINVCNFDGLKKIFMSLPDGIYNVYLEYLSKLITIPIMVLSNEVAIADSFNTTNLNENYTYKGFIKTSAGELVMLTINEVEYDCFIFSTII